MNITDVRIGTKFELELINSLGEKIGQTYISQLLDIVNRENIVIAAPIHESRLMFVTTGTRVRIIFLHEKYGLLSATGSITGKEKRDILIAMSMKIDGNMEKIQRRKYFRLDSLLTSGYYLYESEEAARESKENAELQYKKAIVKNISGCGACMVVNEDIPKGSFVNITISLTKDITIKAICKIMRNSTIETSKDKKFELGLYFNRISQRDQDAVIKYIFDQQRVMLKNNIIDKR